MLKDFWDINMLRGAASKTSHHFSVEARVKVCRGFGKTGNDMGGKSESAWKSGSVRRHLARSWENKKR